MQIVRDIRADGDARGASAAIGNFDGVHLGHRTIIERARRDAALGVVTFEPHPRQFFAPDGPPFRLMNAAARASRLERLGVDILYELPFERIAPMPAEVFARDVLADGLGLGHATVGADFHFGKGRDGSAATLVDLGRRFGFGVTVAELVRLDGEISSTRIREALSAGEPAEAARLLGHLHRIEGEVLHGEKRGRALGYPTANLGLEGLHLPRFGVYAVRATVLDGPHAGDHGGVASLGVRPMFGQNAPNFEVHLFDFAGDIYGANLSVALVEFLRPEQSFEGAEALIRQMDSDSARAREILS
ncbi:riboflavin biosynthesis protein RibF [Roseitranquillus sediminis]|uniref:riboflavin biosynthesis protein RibF n=1 Tax=Roseitranquillus sediminis TaxID=2809051 RepID=UPI001D0C4DA8|nr:riboflavin biosynthesis protein RibF [Roseitranquillus sediminis]MBM9594951.1 riboflavin biosynthesis protein RibF [Roseitranquillus sediminis]